VQAVAARQRSKAEAFAKKHGIPEVKDTYEELLADPNIDCILIALPNSLHYEWAARAIRAGKHVLVEKPSTSNSHEAEMLFSMPELSQPNGPILLEAFHNRFFPSWALFNSLFEDEEVEHVSSASMVPWWGTSDTDINFNYNLSGGSIMAMGTYNMSALRLAFGAEPIECVSCETEHFTEGVQKDCDWNFKAVFRFPGDKIGEATTTLKGPTWWTPSTVAVTTRERVMVNSKVHPSQEETRSRKIVLHGLVHGVFWHRIDVTDVYVTRNKKTGAVIAKHEEKKSHKAYTFKEAGGQFANLPGDTHWMSYRYQLEEFVNKIRGRKTQHWVTAEDSVAQMKMIDMAYEKSGLGLRPTSKVVI